MIVRSYAAPVDTVTHDAGARRLVAIDATVTSGASGDALAAEQLWLSAAVVAFATATWTTILRPETGRQRDARALLYGRADERNTFS